MTLYVLSQSCPTDGHLGGLLHSSVASDRFRAARLVGVAKNLGLSVKVALRPDPHKPDSTDLLYVGKPPMRSPHSIEEWIRAIGAFSSSGSKIILDYTDHHLGLPRDTLEHEFYSRVFAQASVFTVPSRAMRDLLIKEAVSPDAITPIPDPFEYELSKPSRTKTSSPIGIWFGHPNNIQHLWGWLSQNETKGLIKRLVVVTSADYLQSMGFSPGKWNLIERLGDVSIFPVAWSLNVLPALVKGVHYALVLSSPLDQSKLGASSNRLVTSLCLGLPTIATPMSSYQEFREFFSDASDVGQVEEFFASFEEQFEKPMAFQSQYASRFNPHSIDNQWQDLLRLIQPSL